MSAVELLSDEELSTKAIQVLVRELGPVESARFLTKLRPPAPGTDSVKRRREWLASIDENALVEEVLKRMNEDPRLSKS